MFESTIPVVDLALFRSSLPSQRRQFTEAFGQALEQVGFVAIANPGIDLQLIAQAYQLAEDFFALPESVKQRYEIPQLNGQRGFVSFGKEHAKDQTAPDLKEFWHIGRESLNRESENTNTIEANAIEPSYLPNLWPTEIPAFQPIFIQLYDQLETCAKILLQACALYLEEPIDLLRNMVQGGNTLLRVLHYPRLQGIEDPQSIRAAAHEDINFITLLCEATEPGLELLQRDGTWRSIHALQGQLICNVGDMLQWFTNGLLRSTTHRVTNVCDRPRLSMPFFVHSRSEVDLTPLPSCIARTGGVAKFPPMTAQAYLDRRLQEIGLITTDRNF
jgi:isopenicillin N synthase-like dioxygenase